MKVRDLTLAERETLDIHCINDITPAYKIIEIGGGFEFSLCWRCLEKLQKAIK